MAQWSKLELLALLGHLAARHDNDYAHADEQVVQKSLEEIQLSSLKGISWFRKKKKERILSYKFL